MSVLEIKNLYFRYGETPILKNSSLRIFNKEKVGIVGINGCGKTTLMNLLAHRLSPDSGEIIWDKSKSFSYLDQHLEVHDNLTISKYLYSVYIELFEKEKQMNKLYDSMAIDSNYDLILSKAEKIQNYLEEKDFYKIKSKVGNIINGLGIDIESTRLLKDLSGGQRVKVFLGKMLLEEKDILLLDEPTNFLDTTHIDWLSKYLKNYNNEFIIISHSKEFLNEVCTVIVDIDNKTLTKYNGNYAAFEKQKIFNSEVYKKNYLKQKAKIKKEEEFIKKNIARASTSGQAKSRKKVLEKMVKLERPLKQQKVKFNFPFTKSFNVPVLVTKNLSIGYNKPILPPIDVEIEFGQKYVITGANGVGKTTFIKTILGIIPSLGGKIKLATYNDVLYYSQEENIKDITPIDYIREKYPHLDNTSIRTLLGTFGVKGKISIMRRQSGGEVSKVRFARLSLESSNLLVLDEPTSHLDQTSKKALLKEIKNYPGTVILVSHEKSFYKELNMTEISFETMKRSKNENIQ